MFLLLLLIHPVVSCTSYSKRMTTIFHGSCAWTCCSVCLLPIVDSEFHIDCSEQFIGIPSIWSRQQQPAEEEEEDVVENRLSVLLAATILCAPLLPCHRFKINTQPRACGRNTCTPKCFAGRATSSSPCNRHTYTHTDCVVGQSVVKFLLMVSPTEAAGAAAEVTG